MKSIESTPPPRKDIDLEAVGGQQPMQTRRDNDEAGVVFDMEEEKGEGRA